MAKYLLDMAKETTQTSGTGTYTLQGAVTNFQTFVARATEEVGAGPWASDEYYYVCTDNSGKWEFGSGVLTDAASDTLSRATIHSSSNSGAEVSWPDTSAKDIFSWIPGSELQNEKIYGAVALTADETISATTAVKIFDANYSEVTDVGGWWDSVTNHRLDIGFDCLLLINMIALGPSATILMYPNVTGTDQLDGTVVTTTGEGGSSTSYILNLTSSDYVEIEAYNTGSVSRDISGDAAKDETQMHWAVIQRL